MLGCTDYDFAVKCSAVFKVTFENDAGVHYLLAAARRDAARKASGVGTAPSDVAQDILTVEPEVRRKLAGKPVINDEFSRCSALYD